MKQHKIGRGFTFAVVLGIAAPSFARQAVQWRVEDGGNGHWYRGMRASLPLTWFEARDHAQMLGGHLVAVGSAAEFAFVHQLAGDGSLWNGRVGPWLGGYQDRSANDYLEPSGGWKWIVDEPWYSGWGSGEPGNMLDVEDFLHYISYNGTCGQDLPNRHWNDYPSVGYDSWCTPTPIGLIIEWSADCNADGIVDYGQILQGQLVDADSNGVPDVCEIDPCPGDVTDNGVVDGVDLSLILALWGTSGQKFPRSDANGDGIVDANDLAIVLGGWGSCPD